MSELSPAAQAVLDAYKEARDGKYIDGEWIQDEAGQVAAALRAVVDQVVPLYMCSLGSTRGTTRLGVRQKLIAIAAELEGGAQ